MCYILGNNHSEPGQIPSSPERRRVQQSEDKLSCELITEMESKKDVKTGFPSPMDCLEKGSTLMRQD